MLFYGVCPQCCPSGFEHFDYIYIVIASVHLRLYLFCLAVNLLFNPESSLTSAWWQREEHSFPLVPHLHRRFGTFVFFLIIYNYRSHSLVTERPKTSLSHSQVSCPYRRLCACLFLLILVAFSYTCSCRIHTDAMNNRRRKTSLTNMCTSHFICKGSKRLLKVCVWEGAGDRTETAIFWPPFLWPSMLCLPRFPDAQPEALGPALCWMMAFFTASYQQLLWSPNSIGVPEGPLGRVWLSLPRLVYNFVHLPGTRTVLISVLTELYNSYAHSIAHSIFEIACLIVIKQK